MSEVIRKYENLAHQVQEMLALYVFPELANPIGFLRARACWAYGQFSSFPFTNIEHQKQVLEKICGLILDPDLPVKYEAALALPKILSWEISKSRVKGEISNVLKIYLDLINEIDSEEIIEALEDIVTSYSDEVLPFAIELTIQLSSAFNKLATKENVNEDDDSAMAAVSVLNTINKIIETVSDKSEELIKISHIVLPLLQYSLSKEGSAYIEEGLNMMSSLIYYAPSESLAHLYSLSRLVLNSLQESDPYGIEKTEEVFPVLANFISKYQSLTALELENLVKFYLEIIKDDANATILSCKLLITLLEHLKSKVSLYIPAILSKMFSVIQTSQQNKIKTICCQVVYASLCSDVETSLTFLDQSNSFKPIFNYSLNNFKYIRETISRTQVVVGISLILPFIPRFPNSLSIENSVMIFKKLIEMILLMEDETEETDTSPFVDAEEFNLKSDEIIAKIRANIQEESDDDVLYETDADEFYDSAFETLKYKIVVKNEISKVNPEILTQLMGAVDAEQKEALQKVFNNS